MGRAAVLLKKGRGAAARCSASEGRLGWTTWLGRRQAATDAGDLCLDAEAFAGRAGAAADERNQQIRVVREAQ